MDRTAVERHQQVREQATTDAHQRRQNADAEAVDAHQRTLRQVISELPALAREDQSYRGGPGDGDEHDLEQPLRRVARDHAAGDDADYDRQPPDPKDRDVDGAA